MKLLFILITSVMFAQTNINPRVITINSDAEAAFRVYTVTQVDPLLATALSVTLDASTTAVRVDSGVTIRVNDAIKIDNEVMLVTAKSGRDLTVTRGALGTVPASHDAGSAVQ